MFSSEIEGEAVSPCLEILYFEITPQVTFYNSVRYPQVIPHAHGINLSHDEVIPLVHLINLKLELEELKMEAGISFYKIPQFFSFLTSC